MNATIDNKTQARCCSKLPAAQKKTQGTHVWQQLFRVVLEKLILLLALAFVTNNVQYFPLRALDQDNCGVRVHLAPQKDNSPLLTQ